MKTLKGLVNTQLNYGRHLIRGYIESSQPYVDVLDIGAGHGDDLMFAKQICVDSNLFAVENYLPYVKELEAKGVKVFSSNIEKEPLPFDDHSLDIIVINQVFEHVKEVFWILNEITRVLRVGGSLIVGVPNLASLHNRLLLAIGSQPTSIQNNSAHVRGYTLKDFKALLNSGFPDGYDLVNYGGSNFYPFPPAIAKPLATLFPSMAYGLFMHWEKNKEYTANSFLQFVSDSKLETNFYLGEKAFQKEN